MDNIRPDIWLDIRPDIQPDIRLDIRPDIWPDIRPAFGPNPTGIRPASSGISSRQPASGRHPEFQIQKRNPRLHPLCVPFAALFASLLRPFWLPSGSLWVSFGPHLAPSGGLGGRL